MVNMPGLEDAYALQTPEEMKVLYAAWAASYDAGFGEAQGYQLPREVVLAFIAARGSGPVLDVGAGTGLVGEGLKATQVGPVDALDISAEMIEVARLKGVYRDLIVADILASEPAVSAGGYGGVVSAGTFTLGHVGPEGLAPLLAACAPGGLCVISVNAAHYERAGFAGEMDRLAPQITERADKVVRIYDDRADARHRNDTARLLVFRKA